MEKFLSYLLVAVFVVLCIARIGYFYGACLILIAILCLMHHFREYVFGIFFIATILMMIYRFFTDQSVRAEIFLVMCFISGIVCLKYVYDRFFSDKNEGNNKLNKGFYWAIGIFSISFLYLCASPVEKKESVHVPTPSYSYHHEYSPNYYRETPSDSNYRHSDSSSDTMREKTDIPYVSVPENQTIAEKSEEIIAKVDITHEDETFSPPIDEVYLSDDLEYVTSDEQGNKYYINRSFGNYIMTTSFEGTVCHAMFRKILNNSLEVEVSEYEFDQGRVMKKKILAYEDSMIKFRNENGFREIYFSTISGYTSDDSIIVGWGMANFAETHQWKPINDKLYNALYDAAYKRVK